MVRTLQEFITAKKRLNTAVFSIVDVVNILNTEVGYIIVNNVKIPIKNGALDLTTWDKPIKAKKDKDKRKEQLRKNQKAYRDRIKAKKDNPVESIVMGEYLSLHAKNNTPIKQIANKKPSIHTAKRIITAKRLIKTQIAKKTPKKLPNTKHNIIKTNECDMLNTLTQNKLLRVKKCLNCNGFNNHCQYHIKTIYINGINISDINKGKIALKGI